MAINVPIRPDTIPAQRATLRVFLSLILGRIFLYISIVKAVDIELILLEMVLMVAAKRAAMSSPANPAGSWLIMKKGKMASVFCMVMSTDSG